MDFENLALNELASEFSRRILSECYPQSSFMDQPFMFDET